MRISGVLLIAVFVLASCWTTPTPTVSPLVTPTPFISPLATQQAQAVIPTTLQNGDFEDVFTVRSNAVTVARFWQYWQLNAPPCRPGSAGCDIPCPSNCGTCQTRDQGCFWAQPEYAASYIPNYKPDRGHGGLWAQKTFVYGRQGRYGLYQQVNITSASVLTFSIWYEAWQCVEYNHCSLQWLNTPPFPNHPNPSYDPIRVAFLMGQWGCTNYPTCKLWTATDLPYKMHLRVGIDPTGGISPTASSVIWGSEIESFDYWSQATVTATKIAPGIATVFAYASPSFDFARTSNDVYLDDAELKIQPLGGPTYRMFLPIIRR
jgi:hypothetical protein